MKSLFVKFTNLFDIENPYLVRNILWLAFAIRMVSVIFARGFGMLDDHFLIIEASQSWVDGTDYNDWLPSSGATIPNGHSFFYSGIHFCLFTVFKWIGLTDPQWKMLVIRLLHALFSLLIVKYAYKIAEVISNKASARFVAILLAIYWFMPWLSVRNLVEVTCIPFMMWGAWVFIHAVSHKASWVYFLLSGIIFGLAINVRFQVSFFLLGFGLGILINKQWRYFFYWAFGVTFSFLLLQGLIDYFIWGYPLAEFIEYVKYNIDNANNYFTNVWYMYLLLILVILLPPLCFFLLFGFLKSYKVHWALFLGTLFFLIFHSYFPNKQERFILPIIPFIILLGGIGWKNFMSTSTFWFKRSQLYKILIIVFFAINLILLPVISTMYSKRARVESMTYLSKYKNIKTILMEDINRSEPPMPPQFYLGQWIQIYNCSQNSPLDSLLLYHDRWGEAVEPRFVLFFEDNNLYERVNNLKPFVSTLVYETTIYPGFIDRLLYQMNPMNANETVVIYRNTKYFPFKSE